MNDPLEIIRQIKASEGERIYWKMEALRAALFVFVGNRGQLLNAIGNFERKHNAAVLWDVQNREALREFQREILRLVHNFLTAAYTLVEHTRILMSELYQNQPFHQEYQRKVEETFIASDLTGFLQRLRNWMLHRGLIPIVAELSAADRDDNTLTSRLVLDINVLKSWDGWNERAKRYLSSLSSRNPRLKDLVDSYSDLVHTFYVWLERRMLEMHMAAFQERDRLVERLNEIRRDNEGRER